ncbi:MAG: PIN domain-containing protein [Bacteroidetes bacterium]|nr:PIN domain-containing protein [Candidatus Colenecus caballi]
MEQIKVFLDTNIVLDYFTGRMGDCLAEKIVQIGQTAQYRMCISVLTGINVLYISRKLKGHLTMSSISEQFELLSVTDNQWNFASDIRLPDPEDALQFSCARENGCRVLVTRDSHLLDCNIAGPRIMSPSEFIDNVTI